MKRNKVDKNNFLKWLGFFFAAILVPIIFTTGAFIYLRNVIAQLRFRNFQIESSDLLETLRVAANTNEYIVNRLNETYVNASSEIELYEIVEQIKQQTGLRFEHLVWNNEGKVVLSSFDQNRYNADWTEAYKTFLRLDTGRSNVTYEDYVNTRKIYGPHFFPHRHSSSYRGRNPSATLTDATEQRGHTWVRVCRNFGLSVHFEPGALDALPGLQAEISRYDGSLILTAIEDQKLSTEAYGQFDYELLKTMSEDFTNPQLHEGYYVFKNYISESVFAFCILPEELLYKLNIPGYLYITPIIFLLLFIFIAIKSFKVYCRNEPLSGFKLKKQLLTLFILSNLVSVFILSVLAFDYLKQYEIYLKTKFFNEGMAYLQNIDQMFVGEFTLRYNKLDAAFAKTEEMLKTTEINRKIVETLTAGQERDLFRLFLIGSHTKNIGSELGIMRDGNFIDEIRRGAQHSSMINLVESMGQLGQYYLSRLNRDQICELVVTQIELVAENLGQIRPNEMFHEFFTAHGNFWQWGMGSRYYPAHIRILSLNDPTVADYVFICLWQPFRLHYNFIKRHFFDFNRNEIGMKIMAIDENMFYSFPDELLENEELRNYSQRLVDKTVTEIDYCQWEGKEHLLIGLKCNELDSLRLLGLYPVENINRKVSARLNLFIGLAFLSILVSSAFGIILSRSVLVPLSELQKGINAVKRRDFSYRVPELGNDELGNLAKIFNTTLVDLEEIHVASVVQSKLIEKTKPVSEEELEMFGDTVSFFRLGGDYLEMFKHNEIYYSIVLGDVAGQGVGASMVMAFLKACILKLELHYLTPAKLIEQINQNFSITNNSKHKKFMTFQYVLINSQTFEITVANSGHCFPIIIKGGTAQQLKLPSTPLGATKKNQGKCTSFVLEKGQKAIFYSGGMYRNKGLSFELMCDIIIKHSTLTPEDMYKKIMNEIFSVTSKQECNDDLSLMIVSRKK